MHDDVCEFISQQIYEGRLDPHGDCGRQSTAAGTGLRWLRAEHQGNVTSSPEEASLIVTAVRSLLGTDWTDDTEQTQPLTVEDFVVVTPYKDQRLLIEELFNSEADTRGLHVATVDKFQGQENAVVFFAWRPPQAKTYRAAPTSCPPATVSTLLSAAQSAWHTWYALRNCSTPAPAMLTTCA
jgi:superfamily I DNA and/or RNA helicase